MILESHHCHCGSSNGDVTRCTEELRLVNMCLSSLRRTPGSARRFSLGVSWQNRLAPRGAERCDYSTGSRNSIADWRSGLNETETPFFIRFFPVILVLVPRSASRT